MIYCLYIIHYIFLLENQAFYIDKFSLQRHAITLFVYSFIYIYQMAEVLKCFTQKHFKIKPSHFCCSMSFLLDFGHFQVQN